MSAPARALVETALYRLHGAQGELLYVGITNDLERRLKQHSERQPWWHQVDNITYETFGSREAAVAAEARAIWYQAPVYNVIGQKPTLLPHWKIRIVFTTGFVLHLGSWSEPTVTFDDTGLVTNIDAEWIYHHDYGEVVHFSKFNWSSVQAITSRFQGDEPPPDRKNGQAQ